MQLIHPAQYLLHLMHLLLCLVYLLLHLVHLLLHLVHLLLHNHLVHLPLCLVLLNKLPLSLTNQHLWLQQHLITPSVYLMDHTLIQTWHTTFCLVPQATLHRMTPWEWILIPAHLHLESIRTWTVHLVPKHVHQKCGMFTTNRWTVSDTTTTWNTLLWIGQGSRPHTVTRFSSKPQISSSTGTRCQLAISI